MTGTGTQADPYIPALWSEFVTAIGTQGAYVSLAEGTIWDMNDIAPEGFTTTITIAAASIAGNGLTIKNLTFTNGGKCSCTSGVTVTGIAFKNLLIESGSVLLEAMTSSTVTLRECVFAGKIADAYLVGRNTFDVLWRMAMYRCAINLEVSGGSCPFLSGNGSAPYHTLTYCNVKITGSSTSSYVQSIRLNNSFWTGDLTNTTWVIGGDSGATSYYSIFDVDVPTSKGLRVNSSYTGNVVKCLYNSDKVASGATVDSPLIGCTTEQLHSASYLHSVGFPIAG